MTSSLIHIILSCFGFLLCFRWGWVMGRHILQQAHNREIEAVRKETISSWLNKPLDEVVN